MNKDLINIAFTSDNNYAQHVCVAIYSLLTHNKDYFFMIYILDWWISEQSKLKILTSLEKFTHKEIKYIAIDTSICSEFKRTPEITLASYYRILLPLLLPDVDKILYIDGDLLIHGDIWALYRTRLEHSSIAAVRDRSDQYSYNFKKIYGIYDDKYCFNAGVILFDLKKVRELNIVQEMIAFARKNKKIQVWMDQDLLNHFFWNDWKELPDEWNTHQYFFLHSRNQYDDITNKEFMSIRKNPKIIHFTGNKPWSCWYIHPFRSLYFYYLKKTAFRDFQVSRDLKKYAMNLWTFLFLKFFSYLPRKYYLIAKKYLRKYL